MKFKNLKVGECFTLKSDLTDLIAIPVEREYMKTVHYNVRGTDTGLRFNAIITNGSHIGNVRYMQGAWEVERV